MKPKLWLAFLLFALGVAESSPAQTAHDYFNELKVANTFNHYKDEYVCFRDDDVPSFAVVAKASDVIEHMKNAGDVDGVKALAPAKDSLFVQIYYKGVGSEQYIYEPVKKDPTADSKEYSYAFGGQAPGKMVYSINWATGRYLQHLYIYQQSRTIPAKEGSGKCEPIHPGVS
jgi:hypothetical protein